MHRHSTRGRSPADLPTPRRSAGLRRTGTPNPVFLPAHLGRHFPDGAVGYPYRANVSTHHYWSPGRCSSTDLMGNSDRTLGCFALPWKKHPRVRGTLDSERQSRVSCLCSYRRPFPSHADTSASPRLSISTGSETAWASYLPGSRTPPASSAAFHSRTVLSQLAVARVLPSGLNATSVTSSVWPARVVMVSPVDTSHSRNRFSCDPQL